MAFPRLNLRDLDLEKLDEFLMSDRAPEDCMQLSDLDGFLTAVVIGPELIMPSEWLPVIWGEDEPLFENLEEAQDIIGVIMGRYNQILQQIGGEADAYEPLFWEAPDGSLLAADWAEGFMDGVALRRQSWRQLLESDDGRTLLAPIVAFLHDEHGNSLLDAEPDDLAELRRAATDLIVPSVQGIDAYWKTRRQKSRNAPRIGRNEPCPCGSGRKYKRCCGAN
jgi:uncharacterized protein